MFIFQRIKNIFYESLLWFCLLKHITHLNPHYIKKSVAPKIRIIIRYQFSGTLKNSPSEHKTTVFSCNLVVIPACLSSVNLPGFVSRFSFGDFLKNLIAIVIDRFMVLYFSPINFLVYVLFIRMVYVVYYSFSKLYFIDYMILRFCYAGWLKRYPVFSLLVFI